MSLTLKSANKVFGGVVRKYTHSSASTNTTMTFCIYLPPQALQNKPVPALYFLSGLTCTEDNFITKAGAIRTASRRGIALVCPDTSPRGASIEGEDDAYDFGTGAGFYLNATRDPWSKNYNMYDYVTRELPDLLASNLPIIPDRKSVFGHSMGGHGALICFLKNPGMYKSVSAFSPICHPSNCPWGEKAFSGYLGDDREAWKQYDATELVKKYNGPKCTILIDQGSSDEFLEKKQLLPDDFEAAAKESNTPVTVRMQDGYDHSYYFISTFIDDHIEHHARALLDEGDDAKSDE